VVLEVLNDSTESLNTAVWGRQFHSTVVRWENEAFLCCVLHSGTWYDRECMFLECLRGGECLSLLLTATLSWEILYIMTRRASQRRSSRLRHSRCCSMSPTLDVLRCLLAIYIFVSHSPPLNHFYFVDVRFKVGIPYRTGILQW
jgi:hypothetical protein